MHETDNFSSQQRFLGILFSAACLHFILLLGWEWLTINSPHFASQIASRFESIKKEYASSQPLTVNLLSKTSPPSTEYSSKAAFNVGLKTNNLPQKIKTPSPSATSPGASDSFLNKRTISAAAHLPEDADYLARWQAYVEKLGNLHYPSHLLKNNLRGDVRLLVALNKDGSVQQILIRRSSGSQLIDQAAIDLVLKAAPFEPLPSQIASEIDVLEIIRTWQFRGKLSTSG